MVTSYTATVRADTYAEARAAALAEAMSYFECDANWLEFTEAHAETLSSFETEWDGDNWVRYEIRSSLLVALIVRRDSPRRLTP